MKKLVTGGAGFIGSHLASTLLKRNEEVRILDNFSTGIPENLARLHGELEVLEGDIRDADIVKEAVHNVDVIFHMAAYISPPQSLLEPKTCYDINVHGSEILFEAARKADVQRIIVASSAAVYGDNDNYPLRETSELRPLSPYAASKIINEIYSSFYSRIFNIDIIALRYFNVYGPRQSRNSDYAAAIPIFISNILAGKPITIFGDGHQTRDLIYVDDVVNANLNAAASKNVSGEIMNICTGKEISLMDVIEKLMEITKEKIQIQFDGPRPGDIFRSVGDPQKAQDLISFQALTSIEEGLQNTVSWIQER